MRKLRILIATLALTALMAAPVAAQTTTAEVGGVSATATNEFLGQNRAEASVGNVTAVAEDDFLFFSEDFFFFDDHDDDFEFVIFVF